MDRRVALLDDAAWFAARTEGAPEALRARAESFLADADGKDLPARLAAAAHSALASASDGGARRATALDLLAADALITLALLFCAERAPGSLLQAASALRTGVPGAT